MKRNILNKLLIAGCLLAMVSCKAKKMAVAANTPPAIVPGAVTATQPSKPATYNDNGSRLQLSPPDGMEALKLNPIMDELKASQFTFNTFSGRADAKLDINGDKNDVNLIVRIDHDKKIWVSVTVTVLLTVEVARAVITPDSIMTMDKVHGTYLKKPFSYVYKYTNDQVSYQMLEAMLVGNAIPSVLKDYNATVQTDNGNTIISGTMVQMIYSLIVGNNTKVNQLNLSDHNAGQSLQVMNNGFMQIGSKTVPAQINILSIAPNKKVQANIHYTKIDLDQPLQYPFNIPDSYKSADEN